MKALICVAVLTAGLAYSQAAAAASRLEEGAMGAAAGALVAGPVGLVAGGVVGYTQGHKIQHGIFHGTRHYYWRDGHRYYHY